MNKNIDRLDAQKDMRSMTVSIISQSSQEQIDAYRKVLFVEAGTAVKMQELNPLDAVRDEEGFAQLKNLAF